MNYYCRDERRRSAIGGHPLLNGIDFLEVIDRPNDPVDVRQTVLNIHFINPIAPGSLQAKNFRIEGGERITGIKVVGVSIVSGSPPLSPLSPLSPPADSRIAVIKLDRAGDFSVYTLRIIQDEDHIDPPVGIDPILASIEFSFKVLCENDFDCKSSAPCEEDHIQAPDINYLAKDYASFRQLMLDRLAVIAPKWKDRNPADVGVVMLELLAYAGDLLSYRQDAIATEAYLGTSRLRTSVRRHARLVDYYMHDGSNARMFVHIDVATGIFALDLKKEVNGEKTRVVTRCNGIDEKIKVFSPTDTSFQKIIGKKPIAGRPANEFDFILPHGLQIYELLHDVILDRRHNEIQFYTWLNDRCTLPKGATSATLLGHLPVLQPGHVLMLKEVVGPITGKKSDADPVHRHPVKITRVSLTTDPVNNQKVTKIEWDESDALPFPLCISSVDATGQSIKVSVALGNMVLVDHGFTIHELLPVVPDPATPSRYRPTTKKVPMTQAAPFENNNSTSASASLTWAMRGVTPVITLKQTGVAGDWIPQRDLLESIHNDEHFVVEVESNSVATLRFGNGIEGKQPAKDSLFVATYRVGNGVAGNIGSDTIKHLITNEPALLNNVIENISNPLPAVGGREMETIEETRNRAPIAFRSRQERAVTLDDYEEVSRWVDPNIQRSAASLRWTGSWRTVFLTVDQFGGGKVTPAASANLRSGIERYRMAGYDLEIEDPKFVSLEIEMTVCVDPTFFATDVKKALLQKLSNRTIPGGQRGIFHPDNFSFGKTVYLSPIYEAAQNTDGVKSVRITKFQRLGINDPVPMNDGRLLLNRFEIARLDNDPNFPERGVFSLVMMGGK